jgi:hypothetical protein
MHVGKKYNIIMYASDKFFMHVTNMQLCMDKYLLCMQVILVFMHGSMFAMHQNLQFFFFFFCLWTNVCLLLWKNVCHVIKMLIQYLATNCLSCSTNSIFEVVTYS